jgi:hypothetical protein
MFLSSVMYLQMIQSFQMEATVKANCKPPSKTNFFEKHWKILNGDI